MSGVKQPLIVQGRAGGWANLKMVAGFLDFGDTFLNIDFVGVVEGLGAGVVGVLPSSKLRLHPSTLLAHLPAGWVLEAGTQGHN